LRFLIDAQLPPLLVRTLKTANQGAIHVFDIPLLSGSDREIWHYAEQTKLIILTKDEDFAALRRHAKTGPAVVWLRMGNIANYVLAERLLLALPLIALAIENGETLVEIR